MRVRSPGQEDLLEEGMATDSSILAWRIPWTEEPGGLQSIGLHRVRHDRRNLARTHVLCDEYCFKCFVYHLTLRIQVYSVAISILQMKKQRQCGFK